jgi:hypothetical protein
VEDGHALLFCKLCGERAIPFQASQPMTRKARERQEAIARPYELKEALLYPFRGLGLYLFIATCLVLPVIYLIKNFSCFGFFVGLAFTGLIIGIQFKIIRSTAEGDNELPDWPDYMAISEMVMDVLTYLLIMVLGYGPLGVYLAVFGPAALLREEPSLVFWAGFSVLLWLGTALVVMAWGAAGCYDRVDAFYVHVHGKAFLWAGRDAVVITNLIFGLQILTLVLQVMLGRALPIVGSALAGILGLYWTLTSPHLIGVLFRRHRPVMDALYEG